MPNNTNQRDALASVVSLIEFLSDAEYDVIDIAGEVPYVLVKRDDRAEAHINIGAAGTVEVFTAYPCRTHAAGECPADGEDCHS